MFEGGHLWPSILIETFALWLMSCFRAKCIFSPSNLFCVLFYVVVSPHVGLTLLFLGTKDTLSSSKKRHGCGKTIKMVCFILFESRSLCRTNVNSEGILKAVTNARQKKSHSFQLSVEHVSFKYELHGLNLTSISKQWVLLITRCQVRIAHSLKKKQEDDISYLVPRHERFRYFYLQ